MMNNHERAKQWLDAHMKYMPSDLTDLRVLLDAVREEAIREAAARVHDGRGYVYTDATRRVLALLPHDLIPR